MSDSSYTIHRTPTPPPLDAAWDDPAWAKAQAVGVDHFHDVPKATDHRPQTAARLLYDDEHLYLQFQVHDRYVRAVNAGHQSMVCRDSCVEFFFSPSPPEKSSRGDHSTAPGATPVAELDVPYFNLENNCGGHQLLYHCRYHGDEALAQNGIDLDPIADAWMDQLQTWSSLPGRVEPEMAEPVTWRLATALPWALFRERLGTLDVGPGVRWSGNFYKCGDETSHPHWAGWRPIVGKPFSFHRPSCFGELVFA